MLRGARASETDACLGHLAQGMCLNLRRPTVCLSARYSFCAVHCAGLSILVWVVVFVCDISLVGSAAGSAPGVLCWWCVHSA